MWPQTLFSSAGAKIRYIYDKQQLIYKIPLELRQELLDIIKELTGEETYNLEENF